MIPRPYQDEAIDRTLAAFERHRSALVVMATGLGKTVTFATLAGRWDDGRVLIVAHREELIEQARDKVARIVGPDHVAVEMADMRSPEDSAFRPRVVVASVQTLSQPRRLARFDPDGFGLVVIDEAHHSIAASYRRVIDHFATNPDGKLLGVTATPSRADEMALGQVYETVAYDYGIEAAIGDGWLVPVRQRAIEVQGLDFSRCRTLAGDLNERDLEEILSQEQHLHEVAAPTVELAGDCPALVFAVTVRHAELLAEVMCRYKPGCAVALSGKTDRGQRRQTVEDFKAGKIQCLVNCGLFLEGFDAPNTAVVVMARPTKSLSLYVQVLGRGTRTLPGVIDGLATPEERRAAIASSRKPSMLVLDFVGNSGKHKIVTAADVLGGKWGQPVREYARRTLTSEGRPVGVEDSLARASDELDLLQEIQERDRRRAVKARAAYATADVSPFEGGRVMASMLGPPPGEEPTAKQLWLLVNRIGWTEEAARSITRRQASGVIGKWMAGERSAASA